MSKMMEKVEKVLTVVRMPNGEQRLMLGSGDELPYTGMVEHVSKGRHEITITIPAYAVQFTHRASHDDA